MAERLDPKEPGWARYGSEHLQRYAFALPHCDGQTVLDVGCGIGYGSYILARNGAARVLGVDRAPEVIEEARARYALPNLSFAVADAETLPLELGSFDVAVSFENIEHLPHPPRFIESVANLLNDQGKLLVSAPNTLKFLKASSPQCNEYHLSEPTYHDLQVWVEGRFRIAQEWEQSPVDFGLAHSGLLSLFSFRLERKIRHLLGRWNERPATNGSLWRTTEIMPLLPERREHCHQFVLVCRKASTPSLPSR